MASMDIDMTLDDVRLLRSAFGRISLTGLPHSFPSIVVRAFRPAHLPSLLHPLATPSTSSVFALQMITTNKKKSQPRSAKRAPKGAAAAAPAAGGARARYAGGAGVPAANGRQAQAAAAIQAGGNTKMAGEAFKIIVSNLPLDVDDAAVKVCPIRYSSHPDDWETRRSSAPPGSGPPNRV